ncbi:MAG: DUF2141 domain-containing protein [Bacteroidota bacterium]
MIHWKNQYRVKAKNAIYVTALLILVSGLSATGQGLAKKGNLKVVVNAARSKTGQVGFFLYNSADAFPMHTEKALQSGFVKVSGTSAEYTFTNISLGTYAVYVFHDEDNDKKLNTNFIGMPKEGIGVSRNAKGHFGPPKYEDAKIDINKPEQTISINLTYL